MSSVDYDKFTCELKELVCHADWLKRYFSEQSRKYHKRDYWLKSGLGALALSGIVVGGITDWKLIGTLMSGVSAFIMANVLPNFKWDSIILGFKEEQEDWTRIHHGYEDLLRVAENATKDEMLFQEFQRVKAMQNNAGLEERYLPKDEKLLEKFRIEVKDFYAPDEKKEAPTA